MSLDNARNISCDKRSYVKNKALGIFTTIYIITMSIRRPHAKYEISAHSNNYSPKKSIQLLFLSLLRIMREVIFSAITLHDIDI